MGNLVRFGIAMDSALLKQFDEFVATRGTASNRSEAVRDLVRDALSDDFQGDENAEVVGTVTMVFDHHASDLSEKLDALQHKYFEQIVSTLHVHLDAHNCLEVLVLRGKGVEIRAISDALLGTKGVKHGKLVLTSTGKEL